MSQNIIKCLLVLVLVIKIVYVVAAVDTFAPIDFDDGSFHCEKIDIPMCKGIGYNLTRMPNDFGHDTQDEAALQVHQFWPLVEIKCSPDLNFFLCSMYVPICLKEYPKPLPPCRGICERARSGCSPIMEQYGFKWPDKMACEKLPVMGDKHRLCMDQPQSTDETHTTPRKKSGRCKNGKNSKNCRVTAEEKNKECQCRCSNPLITLGPESILYNRSVLGNIKNCAYPCQGAFFSPEEKEFANVWITLWSSICAASTLLTMITFLIDTDRFKYPERPIIFMSACYFLVSVGYLVRVFLGHEQVACDSNAIRFSLTAIGPNSCTLVFFLIYYFGMASSIWWVILSFTWFLAAGLKWVSEAIANYSHYFHLIAWLVPAVQTMFVVFSMAIDGDPVSGICFVGNLSTRNLRVFVVGPLFVYLSLGSLFLLAGFVSLFQIRSAIKKQAVPHCKTDKLKKLMIRIGIFSFLYTVPASSVIMCYLYENALHESWIESLTCPCAGDDVRETKFDMQYLYLIIILKYFMCLAVGITTGVWIWSGKTLDSWKKLWYRLCGSTNRCRVETGLKRQKLSCKNGPFMNLNGVQGSGVPLLAATGTSSLASASQHHILQHHHHNPLFKPQPPSHV